MVHLPDASLNLSTVVGAFRLPVLALGAPDRQTIGSTCEDIAGVECFETEFRFERHESRDEVYNVKSAAIGYKH